MSDLQHLTANATDDLNELADWWTELLADRFPGTRRRWHQHRDSDEQAADRADRATLDRAARFGGNSTLPQHLTPLVTTPPGHSPSPARDDVLDLVADITWAVIELRDTVAEHFNAGRRQVGVSEACRWIGSALPGITDRTLTEHCATEARRLVGLVRRGTGRVEDIIELDAACPICGRASLRAYAERMTVQCVDPTCRCDAHDCPCQTGRRHTWAEHDLMWLARVLGAEDTPDTATG